MALTQKFAIIGRCSAPDSQVPVKAPMMPTMRPKSLPLMILPASQPANKMTIML